MNGLEVGGLSVEVQFHSYLHCVDLLWSSSFLPLDKEDNPLYFQAPKSGRAVDMVRYLWEEAQWDPVPGLARAGADQGTVLEILNQEMQLEM